MHSFVISKNVKWCHLIWPTRYMLTSNTTDALICDMTGTTSVTGWQTFWCLIPRMCAAYVSAPVHATSHNWQCSCTVPAADSVAAVDKASDDVDDDVSLSDASFFLCRWPSKCSLYVFRPQHTAVSQTQQLSTTSQRLIHQQLKALLISHVTMLSLMWLCRI